MKPSHQKRKPRPLGVDSFTVFDVLMASPDQPAKPGAHAERIATARHHLSLMRSPNSTSMASWYVCSMAANTLEAMLSHGVVADPDGLLSDGFSALRRASEESVASGNPPVIADADYPVVEGLIDDWAEVITTAPDRQVIQAFRATDLRIRDILAGRLKPHDYLVKTGGKL